MSKILSPSMVSVTIDDGFDIPTAVNDLVKIDLPQGAAARFFHEERKPAAKTTKGDTKPLTTREEPKPAPVQPAVDHHAEEIDRVMPLAAGYRRSANPPGIYLAFVPQDQRWLITGQVDVMLVNFTDHDVLYSWFIKTLKGGWRGVDYGSVPPLAMIHIESVPRDRMALWGTGVVQLMIHPDKPHDIFNPTSVEYKVSPVKLLHEDSFRDYHFVEGRSFVYELLRLDSLVSVNQPGEPAGKYTTPAEAEPVVARQAEVVSFITRHRTAHREAVVDLHIEAMVEDHMDLVPSEMLKLQISYFEKCLESAIADNYYKVTFIHGIGEGVLRNALREKLKDYSQIYFQPAPVQKYGTGAIDVMITHQKEL